MGRKTRKARCHFGMFKSFIGVKFIKVKFIDEAARDKDTDKSWYTS